MIGLKRGTVVLSPYNPEWKDLFSKEKILLKNTLQDIAIEIEHIGSTSVPGIVAKPVIDIVVGINDIPDLGKVRRINEILKNLGYEWRRDSSEPEHHIFAKGSEEKRTVYLHLVEYKGKIWNQDLLFRDYLRENPKIAEEYAKLKIELATKYPDQRGAYTTGKRNFIEKTIKVAKTK